MERIEKSVFIKNNSNTFRKWAKWYDLTSFILLFLRKKVADLVDSRQGKLLDVACGTGAQTIEFARKGLTVTGIDLSRDMLKIARKKMRTDKNVKLLRADSEKLPFRNRSFDVSCISLALHDMPYSVGLNTLHEMKRVTKESGLIIIVDYTKPTLFPVAYCSRCLVKLWESEYYDDFMKTGIEAYLQQADLTVEREMHYLLRTIKVTTSLNRS
ncbi:MAG: methyltransferase domain-containing protein [Syntrophus sp. (in: bacteria)]|nr:methyltransferase domain-containing protein [Syntrophus sp. (in: bacteria)]